MNLFKIFLCLLLALPVNAQTTGKIIQSDNVAGLDVDKNYILNAFGEKNTEGWAEYDDGAVTRPVDGTGGSAANLALTVSTTSPLEDAGSFVLTKSGADAQGEGISYDFKIPSAKSTQLQCIFIDYEITAGTFTAGTDSADSDLIVYMYDKDAAQVIEPQNFKFFSNGKDQFGGCFSPVNIASDDYRLILHVASSDSDTWTMKFDNVKVGVRNTPRGPPVTDWQSYTPTITNGGTTSLNLGKWRRAGDSIEISIFTIYTGAGSSSALTYQLPLGLTIATQKLPGTNQDAAILGTSQWYDASAVQERIGSATYRTSNSISLLIDSNGSSAFLGSSLENNDWIRLNFKVPIKGWSSNTRISDGYEARDVAAAASTSGTVSVTTSEVTIPFNTVVFDKTSSLNASTGRFRVPSSGLYYINVDAATGGSATAGATVLLRIKNFTTGATYRTGVYTYEATTSTGGFVNVSTVREFVAGEDIEVVTLYTGTITTPTVSPQIQIFKLQSGQTITGSPIVALEASATNGTDAITSSLAVVKFTVKDNDTHNAYSTSTGLWTAPESGYYNVAWRVETTAVNLSTSQIFTSALYKNGVAYRAGLRSLGVGVSTIHTSGLAVMSVKLNAGDTLAIYAASDVSTTVSAGASSCYFTVTKVGP